MKLVKTGLWIMLTGLLFSCLTNSDLNTDFTDAPLVGKIYDWDNLPCANVVVTVDDKISTASDINGRFYFTSLKKGSHTVKFSKKGYREDTMEFDFLNQSQVIWWRMISLEQVLTRIEESIDKRDFPAAYDYLNEGRQIDAEDPVLNYLYGIYYFKLARFEQAAEKLEGIIASGYKEPFVYLMLADIYKENLNNDPKALEYFGLYLELADDRVVQLRYDNLKASLENNEGAEIQPE